MSFQIKDRKKIQLFRKCVQLLTTNKDEFHIHFNKTHIRLFNIYQDDTTYMIDLQAPWFSKFVAPECILNNEVEIIQVKCSRDLFLQGFNILDDSELEFLINYDSVDTGRFKVIKTREFFIVEANVPFEIEKELQCDESYEFPDNQLLLSAQVKQLKNLRGIFKSKSKTEIMNLNFTNDVLGFKGEINNKFGYEIITRDLEHYGSYLSNEIDKPQNFGISLSLRHILSLLKISEMIEGNFMAAMELLDYETCVTFLFTHSPERKDFKFCIGIGNVRFQRFENGQPAVQQVLPQQRLKKPPARHNRTSDQDNQISNIKVEENNTGLNSVNFQNQFIQDGDVPDEEMDQQMSTLSVNRRGGFQKARKTNNGGSKGRNRNALINDEEEKYIDQDDDMKIKLEEDMEIAGEDDETSMQPSIAETKRKRNNQRQKNKKKQQQDSNDEEEDSDEEEDQDQLMARKKEFYKEVDNEEFF